MIEAMVNGMQALNFSARESMAEQEVKEGEKSAEVSGAGMAFTIVIGLVFAIALFKFLPHMAATYTGILLLERTLTVDDVLYHLIDGGVKLGIFIGYVAVIGLSKENARVFQYHGAEHMAIYTHEANEPLTVENARRKSTLHPRCGTAFLMVVIIVFILVAAVSMPFMPAWAKPSEEGTWARHILVVLFKLPLLIPVAGIAYEFNRFAGRHADNSFLRPLLWPGLGMQLLTTKRPSDDQLEISLASLRAVLWREKTGTEVPSRDEPLLLDDFNAFERVFPLETLNGDSSKAHLESENYAGQACQN
jgi:uncharacterized protein YqhQ